MCETTAIGSRGRMEERGGHTGFSGRPDVGDWGSQKS